MKLSPRPLSPEEEVDQSRDISGFNKWARSSRTISFIMMLLGWFTIPAEVMLRKDFGQRWFTVINYYAGLLLLLIFSVGQYLVHWIWDKLQDFITGIITTFNSSYEPPDSTLTDNITNKSMRFFLVVYIVMGAYHLFKIWWRNRSNNALHSFDDGSSRLEPIAPYIITPLNAIFTPVLIGCMKLLSKKDRNIKVAPQLVNDPRAFADTVLDPLVLLILGIWLWGIAGVWLCISAVALAVNASWKETARLNKILDFRDSIIEAKHMVEIKESILQPNTQGRIMQQAAQVIRETPELAPQVNQRYPSLMSIIEEVNNPKTF